MFNKNYKTYSKIHLDVFYLILLDLTLFKLTFLNI